MFRCSLILVFALFILHVLCAREPSCSVAPPRANILQCCSKQTMLTEIAEKCSTRQNAGPFIGYCTAECIFNATGLSINGELQMGRAKSIISEVFKAAPEFIPIVEASLKKCEQISKDKIASTNVTKPMNINCNMLAAMTATCTLVESFINCPDSRWQNNEACNDVREYFKVCPLTPRQ